MTQLEITNLALTHLGMLPLTSAQLTANALPSAVSANTYWEPCRDEVLGESDWSFANTTLTLTALDINDADWEYVYSYPTMCVGSIWNVYNEGTLTDKANQDFEIRHIPTLGVSAIYTNSDGAIAEYTYKVTDTELWSQKFAMAFSYRLASSMAMSLSADAKKGLQFMDVYNMVLSEAKRLGASERRKKPDRRSSYIDAR